MWGSLPCVRVLLVFSGFFFFGWLRTTPGPHGVNLRILSSVQLGRQPWRRLPKVFNLTWLASTYLLYVKATKRPACMSERDRDQTSGVSRRKARSNITGYPVSSSQPRFPLPPSLPPASHRHMWLFFPLGPNTPRWAMRGRMWTKMVWWSKISTGVVRTRGNRSKPMLCSSR